MFNFLKDKRARTISMASFVLLAIAIILILNLPPSASAGKADQTYLGNKTCEKFEDNVFWSALAGKKDDTDVYVNWSIENDAPSEKDKDIVKIETFSRYANLFDGVPGEIPGGSAQIENSTEGFPPGNWTNIRYMAYLNYTLGAGEVSTASWECGTGDGVTDSCDIAGQGFDNYTQKYSVHLFANTEGNNQPYHLTDVFQLRYKWCWTPIIADIDVSPESADYEQTFTFTVNVTNPDANTTVKLWTRKIGGSWVQEGVNKYCANCSSVQPPYNGRLTWYVTFVEADIGDWEFKFTATDERGDSVDATSSSTHTGGGAWEKLTVTRTINSSTTYILPYLE